MRKILASLFISLDGVVEAPDQWHFPYFSDDMGAAVDHVIGSADTLLIGRETYDSFAGAWPEREAAGDEDAYFAKKLGDARKIVVSNQELEFTWRNSEQLKGDFVEAVTALKNEPGDTHIGMSGSPSVVRQLLEAGLLDELELHVAPVVLGGGARLFDNLGDAEVQLEQVRAEALEIRYPRGRREVEAARNDAPGGATAKPTSLRRPPCAWGCSPPGSTRACARLPASTT